MKQNRSKWMWYKGDFELFHSHKLHARRSERGVVFPVQWCIPAVYNNVMFRKVGRLEKSETVRVKINGIGHVRVNGQLFSVDEPIVVPAGDYRLTVAVNNLYGLPCAYVEGETLCSNETWRVGRGTGKCDCGIWEDADCREDYADKNVSPETFQFAYKTLEPKTVAKCEGGLLFDYGKETFATLCFKKLTKDVTVYFGETDIEALDTEHSYIIERFSRESVGVTSYAKAFRYLYIPCVTEDDVELEVQYEYLPVEPKSSFKSDNELLNHIWDVATYTMELNSREFYMDGIKRDRWVWSGDAYQSYFVNRYLCFDEDIGSRTIRVLGGKEAIIQHINNITDYTFYWIMSIYDHYEMTGDLEFIKEIFPRMKEFMEFSVSRLDDKGFVNNCGNDWIFVDWADFDTEGAQCAEQILFRKCLEVYIKCATLLGEDAEVYQKMLDELLVKIDEYFWCEEKGAYIDSFESGKKNVTRHANIFALLFGYGTDAQRESIINNVILNDEVPQISTPYFKFYELESMCSIGNNHYVMEQILSYWGAMIECGSTTFWEEFTPNVDWKEQLGMYDRKYGKSLCHAWGASPIYLLGRYFLGVRPTSAGYETFAVEPNLHDIKEVDAVIPVKGGSVNIQKKAGRLTVKADKNGGTFIYQGKEYMLEKDKEVTVCC